MYWNEFIMKNISQHVWANFIQASLNIPICMLLGEKKVASCLVVFLLNGYFSNQKLYSFSCTESFKCSIFICRVYWPYKCFLIWITSWTRHPFLPPVRKTVAQMETGLKTRFLKPDWHSDPVAVLFIIQDVYWFCGFDVKINSVCFGLFLLLSLSNLNASVPVSTL